MRRMFVLAPGQAVSMPAGAAAFAAAAGLGKRPPSPPPQPAAPFFYQAGGFLLDVYSLSFEVYATDPSTQAIAARVIGPVTVDVSSASPDRGDKGWYGARFTAPAVPGRYVLRWSWQAALSTDPVQVAETPFDVVAGVPPALLSTGGAVYALPSDLRAEGVTVGMCPDGRLVQTIIQASRLFEKYTGQVFEARYASLTFDGNGSVAVFPEMPVVGLASLYFASITLFLSQLPLDATAYRVYNRHLLGMVQPDDRLNPRLELYGLEDYVATYALEGARFPRGKQNVLVNGAFGYTEADGSPFGATPYLVNHAVKLMTIRGFRKMTDLLRAAAVGAPATTMEKTRDQQVQYLRNPAAGASFGSFTGDPEIDQIIVQHLRPFRMGAV